MMIGKAKSNEYLAQGDVMREKKSLEKPKPKKEVAQVR